MHKKNKICFVVSASMTVKFIVDHLEELVKEYEVYVVANYGADSDVVQNLERMSIVPIDVRLERKVAIIGDFVQLIKLFNIFRKNRFSVVHSVTPKAGLLSMMAALLARVPNRVHIFTGQVWCNKTGLSRFVLKHADKAIVKCANHILVDGRSQLDYLIEQRVVSSSVASVLGRGSVGGVNLDKFKNDSVKTQQLRTKFGLKASDVVFTYIGRLNKEKGILELLQAFDQLSAEHEDIHLMLVGPNEDESLLPLVDSMQQKHGEKISVYGHVADPESYLMASDVFCLPSYREGFGTSVIEAAASGLPTLATNIYGLKCAVLHNETGLTVDPKDSRALCSAMDELVKFPAKRIEMGVNARKYVETHFSSKHITAQWVEFYRKITTQ